MRYIKSVALSVVMLAVASAASAQATRTWVSGVGDDANPCSRTAPCKTFAGAISKTAAGGEIDALDPGGFGAVNITKSITLDGAGTMASILFSGTNGVIVNGAGIVVTLRNLSLNGGTPTSPGVNGVRIIQAAHVNIEHCEIFNYSDRGIADERTTAGRLNVVDTIIRNPIGTGTTTIGIRVTPTTGSAANSLTVDRCNITGNLASNSHAIFMSNGVTALITRSTLNNNTFGVTLAGTGVAASIEETSLLANATGVKVSAGTTARLSETMIAGSTVNGCDLGGGSIISFGNNRIDGNAGNNCSGAGFTNIGTH